MLATSTLVTKPCCSLPRCLPLASHLSSDVIVSHVERVAQPVADEIEACHRDRNRSARNDGKPGRSVQVLLGAIEHISPAGQWRLDPKTEEADIRFQKYRAGDRQTGGYDDRTHGVGQDLPEHDMRSA